MRNFTRRAFAIGAAVALLILAVFGVSRLLRRRVPPSPSAPVAARSLVVLPLESSAGTQWLSYGLGRDLSRTLGRASGLRVAPTPPVGASPRAEQLRELGALLNVSAILRGTARLDRNAVHLSLSLLSIDADSVLWRSDVARDTLALQTLTHGIASAIDSVLRGRVGLPPATLVESPTIHARAYLLSIRAAYLRSRGDLASIDSATALTREALRRDTAYARGWNDLAELISLRRELAPGDTAAHRQAPMAARRAIALDHGLAEPHVVLARWHEANSNYRLAANEYVTAIRLDPRLAEARYGYSRLLLRDGRTDEALRESRRAHELDPLSPGVHVNYAQMLQRAGRQREAQLELAEQRRIASYLRAHR